MMGDHTQIHIRALAGQKFSGNQGPPFSMRERSTYYLDQKKRCASLGAGALGEAGMGDTASFGFCTRCSTIIESRQAS